MSGTPERTEETVADPELAESLRVTQTADTSAYADATRDEPVSRAAAATVTGGPDGRGDSDPDDPDDLNDVNDPDDLNDVNDPNDTVTNAGRDEAGSTSRTNRTSRTGGAGGTDDAAETTTTADADDRSAGSSTTEEDAPSESSGAASTSNGRQSVRASALRYRAFGTLQVRTEIRRQASRRRTRLSFAFLATLPLILVAAFLLGPGSGDGGSGYFALSSAGAANFVVFTMTVSQTFLLPVMVALLCGDTVAAEASWGSLRYLLAIPIPRGRLLGVKLLVSLVSSLLAIGTLTVSAVVVGTLAFGWLPLRTPSGMEFGPDQAFLRILVVAGYLAVTMLVVGSLSFLLTVSTDAPLAAVGGGLMLVVVSGILDQVEALGDARVVLPTHYLDAWQGLFTVPIRSEEMLQGTLVALSYAVVFITAAWIKFQRKDILS